MLKNPKKLENEFKCPCYLIKEIKINNNIDINNSTNFESNSNNILYSKKYSQKKKDISPNLSKYLKFAVQFIKERDSLLNRINQPNDGKQIKCYLINKNYINELYNIFHLNKIKTIMNQNQGKNDNEKLYFLETNLSDNIKNKINNLNKNDIQQRLDNKDLYYIYQQNIYNESSGIFYYKYCDIISVEILNKLVEIDINIKHNKYIRVNCVFDDNKMIIYINKTIINIANYYNDFVFVEYIINSEYLDLIFEEFSRKGYKFITKYLSLSTASIPIKYNNSLYNIKTEIYKLSNGGKIEFNISDKLKILILLAISQNNFNNNELYPMYLINPQWLSQYRYDKIKSLIDNKNIQNIPNINDLSKVQTIINYLNKDELKKLDNKIFSISLNPSIHFNSYIEDFKIKNRYLFLYKHFILVNQKMFKYFQKYFGIKSTVNPISYIHKKGEGDIIIMEDYPINVKNNPNLVENLIIFGGYNKEDNIYNIKYIFEYNDSNILKNEKSYIINYSINDYINARIKFDKNNEYDYICPIIENKQKIGQFYKYIEGFDYRKCDNISKYLKNKYLINAIYLYANELYIKNKIENSFNDIIDKELYLVKKNFISDLKKECGYKQLKNNFIGKINNIPPDDNEIENVIHNLSENDLKLLDDMNISNNQYQKDQTSYEIDIIPIINPNNSSETFMIYHNFKLVKKQLSEVLFKNIQILYDTFTCTFTNKMIIFYYPKNKFNNNKNHLCVISSIDDKNNIINKYVLVYKDKESYEYHIEKIKKNLNNYLQTVSFMNNVAPITRSSNYIEIGFIIKLDETGSSPIPPPPIPSIHSTRQNFPSKPLIQN